MKKSIIYIVLIFIFIMALFMSCNFVYAKNAGDGGSKDTGTSEKFDINDDGWEPASQTSATDASKFKNIGNTIIGVIRVVGTIISVAVFAVLGIKYMIGSVEERAEYKKTMMPYLIGAFLLFGITTFLEIIVNVVQSLV